MSDFATLLQLLTKGGGLAGIGPGSPGAMPGALPNGMMPGAMPGMSGVTGQIPQAGGATIPPHFGVDGGLQTAQPAKQPDLMDTISKYIGNGSGESGPGGMGAQGYNPFYKPSSGGSSDMMKKATMAMIGK